MKEVEIKYRIKDKNKVMAAFKRAGIKFGEKIKQEDISFAPKSWSRDNQSYGTSFLRLRKQGEKIVLTVKRPLKNQLDCVEHETEVADMESMKSIILEIGYIEDMPLNKIRQKTKLDNLEFCLDEVENLGDFFEIEKMIDNETDSEATQIELRKLVVGMIDKDAIEEVFVGYDTLVYEAQKDKENLNIDKESLG